MYYIYTCIFLCVNIHVLPLYVLPLCRYLYVLLLLYTPIHVLLIHVLLYIVHLYMVHLLLPTKSVDI